MVVSLFLRDLFTSSFIDVMYLFRYSHDIVRCLPKAHMYTNNHRNYKTTVLDINTLLGKKDILKIVLKGLIQES